MGAERIAIIYPESTEAVQLKEWLKPFGSLVQVVSFNGLRQAVPLIEKFPCDLLLVADRFPEAQGTILLKGLRKLCPKTQIILLAADTEAISDLKAIAKADLEVQYFPKPWDKQGLMAHIEASIGKDAPSFATALALEEEQAVHISNALEDLLVESSALSIYLVTDLGQVLDYKGSQFSKIGEISSLLGGSFAALQQIKDTLGERGSTANLIHSQGQTEDLYAFSVGSQALLVLRFAAGPSAPKIGTVVFYARQAVAKVHEILVTSSSKPTKPFLSEEVDDRLQSALDQLFSDAGTEPAEPATGPNQLMDFTAALKRGLVSKGLMDRWGSANKAATGELTQGESF